MSKTTYKKTAKGIISLITIIAVLLAILASSLYYENSITANVVKETTTNNQEFNLKIIHIDSIKDLSQLNEGWYQIRNGYVFYLDSFSSYIPMWIKVTNPNEQNGLLVVDSDGTIKFDKTFRELPESEVADEEENKFENEISGNAVGMEKVSGFVYVDYKRVGNDFIVIMDDEEFKTKQGPGGYEFIGSDGRNYLLDPASKELFVKEGDTYTNVNPSKSPASSPATPVSSQSAIFNPSPLDPNSYVINNGKEPKIYKRDNLATEVQKCTNAQCTACLNNACVVVSPGQIYIKGRDAPVTVDKQITPSKLIGTYIIVQDNKPYEIKVEKQDNNYLKLTGDNSKLEIPTILLDKVDFDTFRFNSQASKITITTSNQEVRTISISQGEGYAKFSAEDRKKEGNTLVRNIEVVKYDDNKLTASITTNPTAANQRIEEVTTYDSGEKITVIQTGLGSNSKTTSTYKFKDGTERTLEGKQGSTIQDLNEKINSITYTIDGKKIEVTQDAYNTFNDREDAYQLRIMRTAKDLGITSLELREKILQQGGLKIETKDNTIYGINGEIIISSSTDSIHTTYENTKFDFTNKQPIYQSGSRLIEKSGEDLKIVKEYVTNEAYTKFEYEGTNKYGYTSVKISEGISGQETSLGTLKLEPISDSKLPVYGMYPVATSSGEYYLQTGYGPFGFLGTYWVDRNGKKLTDAEIKQAGLVNAKVIEGAVNQASISRDKSTPAQESSQRFFAEVERVFSEFRGLKYYETLFFDEGSLLAWRDSVDRIFATMFLGTEYWSSGLCSQYIDGEDSGIAYAETPQGLAQVGAHVEATRTQPISGLEGNEYIYKITFNIRNGDFKKDPRAPEEMNINIVLKGQKTARVFKNNIKIERGDTFGRVGSSAIVQDSNFLYGEVCITFDKVPFKWSIDGKELCNKIIEGSGESTPLSGRPSGSGAGSSGSGNDINDF